VFGGSPSDYLHKTSRVIVSIMHPISLAMHLGVLQGQYEDKPPKPKYQRDN